MKKMTGKEWNEFYSDPVFWEDGVWYEGEEFSVDGQVVENCNDITIKDDAIVRISGGVVFLNDDDKEGISLESYFTKWKKLQTEETILFKIHKNKAEEVKRIIKAYHGKIL